MMNFKRSFWGYSPEQVQQLIDDRSDAFKAKKLQLENDLESVSQSGKALEQLLSQLQVKYKQAYQRKQIIESSKPILDLFIRQCQNYTDSQMDTYKHSNHSLVAEISQKTAQIEADQQKLTLFWQNLHSKLSDLLDDVEREELSGRTLLSKYVDELDAGKVDLDLPQMDMPNMDMPNMDIPQIDLPQMDLPQMEAVESEPLPEYEIELAEQEPLSMIEPAEEDQYTRQEIDAIQETVQQEPQPAMQTNPDHQFEPIIIKQNWAAETQEPQPGTQTLTDHKYEPITIKQNWAAEAQKPQTEMEPLAESHYEPITIKHSWAAESQAPQTNFAHSETTHRKFSPDLGRFNEMHSHSPSAANPFDELKADAALVWDAFNEKAKTAEDRPEVLLETETEEIPIAVFERIEATQEAAPVMEEAPAAAPSNASNAKQQALVMDNDATILAILRIILQRDGFGILECSDGHQASLHIDRIDPPQLAILGTDATFLQCLELVRKIRNKPEWDQCKIIMICESSSSHEISELMKAGANDYISKPVNTRELVNRMRNLTGINAMALL